MKTVEPIQDKKLMLWKQFWLPKNMANEIWFFSIGINTAYRISDLRQLKLADVFEITRGRVVVKDRLSMKEQKTAKHNSVYISNKLRKTILEYVQQEFDHYLFPSRKGTNEPLNRQSLWRIIHDAGTAIGLKDIGPHSMRKTFGYFLYKQGTKTEIIQSLLNHSS